MRCRGTTAQPPAARWWNASRASVPAHSARLPPRSAASPSGPFRPWPRRMRTWACRRGPGRSSDRCRKACATARRQCAPDCPVAGAPAIGRALRIWRGCRASTCAAPASNRCSRTTCWACPGCGRWTSAATRCANCRRVCSPTPRACVRCDWTATACNRCRRACSRECPVCRNCACQGTRARRSRWRRHCGAATPNRGRQARQPSKPLCRWAPRSPCAWR